MDVVEKGQDLRYLMNLHNNEAGRLVIFPISDLYFNLGQGKM